MVIFRVVAVLIVYQTLAWFTGTLLHLKGAELWILRGGLALLGLIGAGTFLWFHRRMHQSARESASKGSEERDLYLLVRDAGMRLDASGREKASLNDLPIFYLLGESGSTKTSVIVHSGLEPEILAGQVYQDNLIATTHGANFWYTRQALFVDCSGALLDQPAGWQRLLKLLEPSRISAIIKGRAASRAAIVCVDCESIIHSESEALNGLARKLNGALQEMSRVLGIEFPVYVLFTRADRIPFFAEYARNLTREEASQAFGVTLPLDDRPSGIYAEQQARRLTRAFDDLFYCAADKRFDLLEREIAPENVPGVYQFPREMRKLRTRLVQLLVDAMRPSQLSSNAFLRGFYFCGARAVVVEDVVAQPATVRAPSMPDATMAFRISDFTPQASSPAPATISRKVPEWVFLGKLFNDVILNDRTTLGASTVSSKTSRGRRLMRALAALVCVVLTIGFVVSFVENRKLQSELDREIRATADAEITVGEMPSQEALENLESLRQTVAILAQYEREGAPLSMRWGLFTGRRLYPEARRIYFDRFRKMLLSSTQSDLLATLQGLPNTSHPGDDYDAPYKTLKAYLIIAAHHDKSSAEFLAPVLFLHWSPAQQADPAVAELAKKQFEFYATELMFDDPYSFTADAVAVERARRYLSQFAGSERLYRFMIAEASRVNPPVNFNRMFPGASEVLIAGKDVEGAFTKGGWIFVQNALAHLEQLFAGEEWVLGQSAIPAADRARVQQELATRYRAEFIQRWSDFLQGVSVAHYGSVKDGAKKLGIFASNQSPLLILFSVVSQNTAVGVEEITTKFQPVWSVVPPGGADRYVGPGNASYMTALIGLQTAMEQVAGAPTTKDSAAADPARNAATAAKQAAYQIAQGFAVDNSTHIDAATRRLLEAPIQNAENVLSDVGTGDLNANARALCARFHELSGKLPFSSGTTQQISAQELNGIFKPHTGALWQFYEQNLKALVQRRGAEFVPGKGGENLSPAFLAFFNRAAAFSDMAYGSNSSQPRINFKLKPQSSVGVQSLALSIAGQTVGTSGTAKQFTWQWGDHDQVKLVGKMGGTEFTFLNYNGPWSVFQFFASAERSRPAGSAQRYEWIPKTSGQPFMVGGKPLAVSYELEMSGAPVFQRGYFSQMQCVARATR